MNPGVRIEHRRGGFYHEPSPEEFSTGVRAYESREKRDPMYKVATFLISHFWGQPADMADALGVLLLTWNQAFYRYGLFDFDRLRRCIEENLDALEDFHQREISTLTQSDDSAVKGLFAQFLEVLAISTGPLHGRRSPVAVAKALHLLAPGFFPLWDDKIARAYGCSYHTAPTEKYLKFCKIVRHLAGDLRASASEFGRGIVKLIDEYNYAKYTKGWV